MLSTFGRQLFKSPNHQHVRFDVSARVSAYGVTSNDSIIKQIHFFFMRNTTLLHNNQKPNYSCSNKILILCIVSKKIKL